MAGSNALGTLPADQEHLMPVEVTGEKLPDPGDLFEMQRRRAEEQELAKRPFQRDELRQHRALWAEQRIASYQFTTSVRGGWGIDTGTVLVTVRHGKVDSAKYSRLPSYVVRGNLNGSYVEPEVPTGVPYDTIPKLFALVERLLDDYSVVLSVHYDTKYGYPVSISAWQWGVSDGSTNISIGGFKVAE